MRHCLEKDYVAILFEREMELIAYALYREEPDFIYLRQFFVQRHFRGQGLGRMAFRILQTKFWSAQKKLCVEVLAANKEAILFWKAVGFQEYSLALEIPPSAS